MGPGRWAVRFALNVGPAALFFAGVAFYVASEGRMPLGGNASLIALAIIGILGVWLFVNMGIVGVVFVLFEALRLVFGRGFPKCPDCQGLGHA
ncbi:MAG TPA: hypothetical protein VEJ18_15110 [Planctomycetota bacterium]|nr:hypothetical protein [Planctomycetota bacterium]